MTDILEIIEDCTFTREGGLVKSLTYCARLNGVPMELNEAIAAYEANRNNPPLRLPPRLNMKPWIYNNPDARLQEEPPKKKRDLSWLWITLSVLLMLCFLTFMAIQPYFESRAYNRLTGAHTTYWDALWLELRVQEAPKTQP